jgi:hypothetical protein
LNNCLFSFSFLSLFFLSPLDLHSLIHLSYSSLFFRFLFLQKVEKIREMPKTNPPKIPSRAPGVFHFCPTGTSLQPPNPQVLTVSIFLSSSVFSSYFPFSLPYGDLISNLPSLSSFLPLFLLSSLCTLICSKRSPPIGPFRLLNLCLLF